MVKSKINAIHILNDISKDPDKRPLTELRDLVDEIMRLGVRDFITEIALLRTVTALRDALDAEANPTPTTRQVSKLLNNLYTDIVMKVNK